MTDSAQHHEEQANLLLEELAKYKDEDALPAARTSARWTQALLVDRAQAHATLAQSLRLKELCWGKS